MIKITEFLVEQQRTFRKTLSVAVLTKMWRDARYSTNSACITATMARALGVLLEVSLKDLIFIPPSSVCVFELDLVYNFVSPCEYRVPLLQAVHIILTVQ